MLRPPGVAEDEKALPFGSGEQKHREQKRIQHVFSLTGGLTSPSPSRSRVPSEVLPLLSTIDQESLRNPPSRWPKADMSEPLLLRLQAPRPRRDGLDRALDLDAIEFIQMRDARVECSCEQERWKPPRRQDPPEDGWHGWPNECRPPRSGHQSTKLLLR